MTTAADVIAAARTLKGTPFQHQGRMPGVAIDCAGVLICVARALGLPAAEHDQAGYSAAPDGVMLRQVCDAALISTPAPEPGGVVLVSWGRGKPPQHLGIVVPYIHPAALAWVHAESVRHKRVIEQRLVFGPGMVLVSCYRFPGVTY